MNARTVVHRLTEVTDEEVAAAESYERTHAERKTVLPPAERRLHQPATAGSASRARSRSSSS
jgi:hypothetical protein